MCEKGPSNFKQIFIRLLRYVITVGYLIYKSERSSLTLTISIACYQKLPHFNHSNWVKQYELNVRVFNLQHHIPFPSRSPMFRFELYIYMNYIYTHTEKTCCLWSPSLDRQNNLANEHRLVLESFFTQKELPRQWTSASFLFCIFKLYWIIADSKIHIK